MKSIRSKIFIMVLCSVIVSSFIIGGTGVITITSAINQVSTENMNLVCEQNASKLDFAFTSVEDSVQTLATYATEEISSVNAIRDRAYREKFSAALKKSALHHIEHANGALAVYMRYNPELVNNVTDSGSGFFFVKNNKTKKFEETPLTDISKYCEDDIEHTGWWHLPVKAGKAIWLDVYHNANIQQKMISYVVPFYKEGTLIGVIGVDISVEYIKSIAREITFYETGTVAIFEKNGTILYHPNFETGKTIEEFDPDFAVVAKNLTTIEKTEDLISYSFDGVDKKLASCTLKNDMVIACFAPINEIYKLQNILVWGILILTLIIVSIASFFAFVISKKITTPIKRLSVAAKDLIKGDFDSTITINTNDEVGELTQTFMQTQKILRRQFEMLDAEAHRDGLTGVGNKSAYMDKEAEINQKIAKGQGNFAVAVFDVNKLKVTNDVFGHIAGDNLLSTVSEHLLESFSPAEVFRIGGDEFVVIVTDKRTDEFDELISACIASMGACAVSGFNEIRVSCAFGMARFNSETDHIFSDVLRKADKEMYKNKTITKQDSFPWEDGVKGYKRIQTERYGRLLQNLSGGDDDYLFLLNTETKTIHFFDEKTEKVHEIFEIISTINPNDAEFVRAEITKIINHEIDSIDINFRVLNKDGTAFWVNWRGNVIEDANEDRFLIIGRASKKAVAHLYNHLTTLFNKNKLLADLQSKKTPDFTSLMLFDVDNFSKINFRYGSDYGDEILKDIACYIENKFSMSRVYHTEKDRFAILLDINSGNEAEEVFQSIKAALEDKCNISAAVVPNDGTLYISNDNICDYAEQVLDSVKKNDKGQLVLFSKESFLERIAASELLEEIEKSIQNNYDGFSLVYQPQVRASDYTIFSAEALLRYTSPTKGMVYPDQFIPILEKTGLIDEVGLWVADQALQQCKKWREKAPNFGICVNLSSVQLKKKNKALKIIKLLEEYDIPGSALTLEITESVPLEEGGNLRSTLGKFKAAGIKIAIDDFGTGYSNLGYLKQLHADIIKVDRMFVKDIHENTYNYNLISNIVEFAKHNSIAVCLEGIESVHELIVLSELEIDCLQGYLFDKPCQPLELENKYFEKDNELFVKRERFIEQLISEKKHAPGITVDMKAILNETEAGLWVIRTDANGNGELFTDVVMRRLLGVEDDITPAECYDHWYRNVRPDFVDKVNSMVAEMENDPRVIQVEYYWMHPKRGEVTVRCTGRCIKKSSDATIFEGFHRIISDMGMAF